jgi:hypothetical protein
MHETQYSGYPFHDLAACLDEVCKRTPPGALRAEMLRAEFARWLGHAPSAGQTARWAYHGGERAPLRRRAEAALRGTLQLLEQVRPATEGFDGFARQMDQVTIRTAERIYAMHMAGEAPKDVFFIAGSLAQVLEGAFLRGLIHHLAASNALSAEDLAPAVFAVAARREQRADARESTKAAMQRFSLLDGTPVAARTLVALSEALWERMGTISAGIQQTLQAYDQSGLTLFQAPPAMPEIGMASPSLKQEAAAPRIHMGTLVAFGASARGGGDAARAEGAYELVKSIMALVQHRQEDRRGALSMLPYKLVRLQKIIAEERDAHNPVEARWKSIEKEVEKEARYLARSQGRGEESAESAVFPLPAEYSAIECMALYIQNAALRGAPLGYLLQQMRGSAQTTFGPTERRYLERIAFYAARRFSSDLTVLSDARVAGVSARESRVADVQTVLARIEVALREQELLPDLELIEMGDRLVQEAVESGELRRDEAAIVLGRTPPLDVPASGEPVPSGSISASMLNRIRARQEVRVLTAFLALDGELPSDVIDTARVLPHTAFVGRAGYGRDLPPMPELDPRNIVARNGETLFQLEETVYARWKRYRLQESSETDVAVIDFGAATQHLGPANALHRNYRRKPFAGKEERAGGGYGQGRAPTRAAQPMGRQR